MAILYGSSGSDFPQQFTININQLISQNVTFVKIDNNEHHPVGSDQIYTADSTGNVKQFEISQNDDEVNIFKFKLVNNIVQLVLCGFSKIFRLTRRINQLMARVWLL